MLRRSDQYGEGYCRYYWVILTLNGVTKAVVINANFIGEGEDHWGGYRAGFEGTTTLQLADFGIKANLGPASESVELTLAVEGVRQ